MTADVHTIDAPLMLRALMGRKEWAAPQRFGPDGWVLDCKAEPGSLIVSRATIEHVEWVHASIAYADRMPTYDDLVQLHRAVFPGGWAYQVFAPPEHHVNIHEHALHLWSRADGRPALPNFGAGGSI